MRHAFTPRRVAAGVGALSSRGLAACGGAWKSSAVLAAAAGALALAGCTPIPIPDAALLEPQPAPKCEARSDGKARQQPGAAADATGDGGAQARLDYERQCYRHAELIARNRLHKLQASVQQTVKAIKPTEGETR